MKESLSETAISAANSYRAIDIFVEELEKMGEDNLNWVNALERFLRLHREFYDEIIILTSEDSGEIDREFEREVQEEQKRLAEIIQTLKEEKGFLERIVARFSGKIPTMAEYFAHCIEDILEGYAINSENNEIVFIYDEKESVV